MTELNNLQNHILFIYNVQFLGHLQGCVGGANNTLRTMRNNNSVVDMQIRTWYMRACALSIHDNHSNQKRGEHLM